MKESRQEDYDLTEEVEQFTNFLRKKYEMDKEKSSGGAVMKKYVSPCGMEMDENICDNDGAQSVVYADGGKASDTLQRRRGDVILGI